MGGEAGGGVERWFAYNCVFVIQLSFGIFSISSFFPHTFCHVQTAFSSGSTVHFKKNIFNPPSPSPSHTHRQYQIICPLFSVLLNDVFVRFVGFPHLATYNNWDFFKDFLTPRTLKFIPYLSSILCSKLTICAKLCNFLLHNSCSIILLLRTADVRNVDFTPNPTAKNMSYQPLLIKSHLRAYSPTQKKRVF